jgi:prepilin-type N-terminal cleavage/methylation domain-containing protein
MRGFTLPEVLIATLISALVGGALFLVVQPVQGMFHAQLEVADLQQRLRVAVDAMMKDLLMAGAGPTVGSRPGPLTSDEAPVLPYRHGLVNDDPQANIFYRPDTITLRYVATTAAQPAIVSHTYYLRADPASTAFHLMHYDGVRGDFPMVDNVVLLAFEYFGDARPPVSIAPPAVGVDVDPMDEYAAGENCLFVISDGDVIPRLPTLGTAMVRLDPAMLTDGPWCPNGASASRFDADLLRIHRVSVRLRLQSAQPSLRGPLGPLFARGGTATSVQRYVPDREIRFDVAPRNLNVSR